MSLQEYREFIAGRISSVSKSGFAADELNLAMKKHQTSVVEFALNRGKSAAFLDTGLGKSLIELEFAHQCAEYTGKPSLILTPLSVAGQMVREGHKFGIDARKIREQDEVGSGVMVANYERLPKLDPSAFGCVVLDESSILKSFGGKTRTMLIDAFGHCEFRLAATATPSPNDHMELGNHAEFLGTMRQQEMLSKWFINDTSTASQDWRLKGHAKDDFWQWVAGWARCATLPSDLGGDDTGYSLPEVIRNLHVVDADKSVDTNGLLFRIPELSATSFHDEKRKTMADRCSKAADLANSHNNPVTVWCESNDESKTLARLINGAVELRGDQTPEEKERIIMGFLDGDIRALVTKPKLAGFGLNFQHCAHAIFASISYSYEQHYQAVRRSHRFGQMQQVVNDIVVSDTEMQIWDVINDKAKNHGEMKIAMANAMKKAQSDTKRMVIYDRPLELWFPDWVKTEEVK